MTYPHYLRCPSLSIFAILVAAVACVPGAVAQQEAPAKLDAHTVVLPVTVRDKKGALVQNLQKTDVTLTQDNRPQTIASIQKAADQPLRVGLLVDTTQAMRGALEAERKAADKFVDAVLPLGATKNQVFLIHFDREVELLQDFSNSPDRLHREIESMSSTQQERYEAEGPETNSSGSERTTRHGHNGTQLYDAVFLACDELMKNKDGRKVLIVFSNGADRGSKDTLNEAMDAADHAGVSVYTVFMKGAEERENPWGVSGGHRSGPVDTTGGWPGGGGYPGGGNGRGPEPRSANGIDGKKVMQEMAARTGGHAFEAKKREDLEPIYALIDQELKGQYLLTYVPDKPDNDGSFHKVVVASGNKDYTIAAPEGYFAPEK